MAMTPKHRWIAGGVIAIVVIGVLLSLPRPLQHDPAPPRQDDPILPPAQTAVLGGRQALSAAYDSVNETLAYVRAARAAGEPVMGVKVLANVDLWRQHIGASGLPNQSLADLLQTLAVIEQRSSTGYPDGSLTPNDAAIISDRLIALEQGIKAGLMQTGGADQQAD